jgi:hypothetical protein
MKGDDEGQKIFLYYIEKKSMWNFGTPIGYDPAWMHVKDTASIPTEISATWQTRGREDNNYKADTGVKIEGMGAAPADVRGA